MEFEHEINTRQNYGVAYNAVLDVSFSNENATEPITLQEAKDWCRIDVSDDDSIISSLITASRIACEHYANLSFISRTVTATIINRLGNFIPPYGPLISITSALDCKGIDIPGFSFKSKYDTNGNQYEEATVTYTAGYANLPANIKSAILNQVAFLYENRGDAMRQSTRNYRPVYLNEQTISLLKQIRVII